MQSGARGSEKRGIEQRAHGLECGEQNFPHGPIIVYDENVGPHRFRLRRLSDWGCARRGFLSGDTRRYQGRMGQGGGATEVLGITRA